jgi:hypothetical protein
MTTGKRIIECYQIVVNFRPQLQFSIEATTSSQELLASRNEEKMALQQVFTLTGHSRRSKSRRVYNGQA